MKRYLVVSFMLALLLFSTAVQADQIAFDPASLEQRYGAIAEKYPKCADSSLYTPECNELRFDGLAQLEDAGIDKLIDDKPDGLTEGKRILMLNNYAFWLYQWQQRDEKSLRKSAGILKKVIELSADRAVAWLNLGDVTYALISFAETETEKAQLWDEARKDYDTYEKLSGKKSPQAQKMGGIDLSVFVHDSKNVCDYVATAYNHGLLKEIAAPQGTATANGITAKFDVGYEGGSCGWPAIKSSGREGETEDNDPSMNQFHFASQEWGGWDINVIIVPFAGKYYTAAVNAQGPQRLVDPNSGPVCNFDRHYTPTLVENKNPLLCERYLQEKIRHNVAWTPVQEGDIEPGRTELVNAPANFDRVADVKLGEEQKITHISHFIASSGGGCGCDQYGLAILQGHTMAKDELNKSLEGYQGKWWHCGGADADLVQENEETFVDIWEGPVKGRKEPQRALLRMSGNSFEPVCRVEQAVTVRPVAPDAEVTEVDPDELYQASDSPHHGHKKRLAKTPQN